MVIPKSHSSSRTMICSNLAWMVNLIWCLDSPQRSAGSYTKVILSTILSTCRSHVAAEHLGLIEPQHCDSREPEITSAMRPAPILNKDTTRSHEDSLVADPLDPNTLSLWNETARKNREVFTEIFRPIPTNLVRSFSAYDVSTRSDIFSTNSPVDLSLPTIRTIVLRQRLDMSFQVSPSNA